MKKIITLLAVALMATAANADTLTACDGTATSAYVPMYGLYYDTQGTISQMIYPADMLTDMQGSTISKVTFYANSPFALGEGSLNFGMTTVDQNEFEQTAPIEGTPVVGTGAPVDGETELTFDLDEPFEYNGGNLLLETTVTTPGTWKTTYFYGTEMGTFSGYYQYTTVSGNTPQYRIQFLPKVTFEYTNDVTAIESVNANKAIAGVRYYNLAGQQMREPNGATIVVTTYTDGTSSTSKVIK